VGAPEGTPIGWIAHIGGFLAGMALGLAFRPPLRHA
jgi:membrane associated rhomboid family serine protease